MRTRLLALCLALTAGLFSQHRRFSWQDYCFNHPAAPFCQGRDYAVKKPGRTDAPPGAAAAANPSPVTPKVVTPSVIVVGGVDWRFADPLADVFGGFHCSRLATSPLARSVIAQLGRSHGLTDAEVTKILERFAGVEQIAFSIHDNRIVAIVMGRTTDAAPLGPETGLKAVAISGNTMLVGHAEAVEEAMGRLARKDLPAEPAGLAAELQGEDFWAAGSAAVVGPEEKRAGAKRFSLTISLRDRFTSELAVEFEAAPDADELRSWQTAAGAAVVEGNRARFNLTMEADEVEQKLGQLAGSFAGRRLGDLVEAARYLPARDNAAPKRTGPVIYGLN